MFHTSQSPRPTERHGVCGGQLRVHEKAVQGQQDGRHQTAHSLAPAPAGCTEGGRGGVREGCVCVGGVGVGGVEIGLCLF